MKLTAVLRETAQVYRRCVGQGVLCVLLQLTLRLMVAAPLLCLVTTEVPYLALASVALYFLIVPVARQNMAEAMQDAIAGGPLFSTKLISMENYGRKFLRGLRQALLLLLWAAPFLAATAVLVMVYKDYVDVATLIRVLMQLGGSVTEGAKQVLLIYAATLLPIALGCAFHSGTRHAIALGGRKLLRGRRLGVLLVWIAGLAVLLPFGAVVAWVGADVVSSVMNALKTLSFSSIALPDLGAKAYVVAAAVVVLFLPALPFKQLMSAVYVRGLKQ